VDNKPRALAWTVVNLKNHRQCKVAYDAVRAENYRQAVTNNMICAADDTNRRDSCQVRISYLRTSANLWLAFYSQGDSGGALLCNGKVYGIVSHGYGCAQFNFAGVYTKIPAIRKWIKQWTTI
jgi:trypsin